MQSFVTSEFTYGGTFKIDSTTRTFKMKRSSVTLVNAAINTDPWILDDCDLFREKLDVEPLLKPREDIKHIHITSSETIRNAYDYGEVLGRGCFGTVLELTDKNNKKTWAMKIINKSQVPQDSKRMRALRQEIEILKMVNHPHIILLYRIFESAKKMYLILEKCDGELGKLFKDKGIFSEAETKEVIRQLTSAVAYLHRNEIVHRDLKLENILLAKNPINPDDELYIKVSDFGLSIIKGHVQEMIHGRCGTPSYISPEVIKKGSYSHLCDVWSIGVIMYVLIMGTFPFRARDERSLVYLICNTEPSYSNINLTNEGMHLLSLMLTKDPANRITAPEIALHPWILGTSLSVNKLGNVLDMMKTWRADMMLPIGSECDWALARPFAQQPVNPDMVSRTSKSGRTALKMPVKNIEFNKRQTIAKDPRRSSLRSNKSPSSQACSRNRVQQRNT